MVLPGITRHLEAARVFAALPDAALLLHGRAAERMALRAAPLGGHGMTGVCIVTPGVWLEDSILPEAPGFTYSTGTAWSGRVTGSAASTGMATIVAASTMA